MKILAISDFHGKLPKNLKREAKKVDLVLALGDYANADKIRKLIFKHWTNKPWYEVVGKKKAKQLEKESFQSGLDILKKLDSIGKPVYLIWGNTDFYREYTTSEPPIIMPGFYDDYLKKLKNIKLLDKKTVDFLGNKIIGHGGYVDATSYIKQPARSDKKSQNKTFKRYMKDQKNLIKLFSKFKPPKNFIFIIHYPPYGIFDKVKFPGSPMNGKHVGWEPYNQIIEKYRPKIVLCGHMHEYQGIKKIGKRFVINPGLAAKGKFAIIDTDPMKVEFFK